VLRWTAGSLTRTAYPKRNEAAQLNLTVRLMGRQKDAALLGTSEPRSSH
jgi:hypothetical protein